MQLIGGDTTRGPLSLSLTLTIQGIVPAGRALTCHGARISDWIYCYRHARGQRGRTGELQERLQVLDPQDRQYLLARHFRPQPRILQGQALRDLASAAIDISDGIIRYLRHILTHSDCSACINLDDISFIHQRCCGHTTTDQALRWALGGGEDYELCFTPEINHGALDVALSHTGAPFSCIAQIGQRSEGIQFMRHHQPVEYDWYGYDNFKRDDIA